ncbi:ZP domain-containing protein [Aphelenchoides besseyi]|nr:ZP domain-containing protein [Aphelenchoides besseyi]
MYCHSKPSYCQYLSTVYLLILISQIVAVDDLDNAVVGTPLIECQKDFVHFEVPTKRPFKGRLFVKGAVATSECVRIYDVAEGPDASTDSNEIPDDRIEIDPLRRHATKTVNHDVGASGSNWRRYLNGGDIGVDQPDKQFRRLDTQESKTEALKSKCPLVCAPCNSDSARRRRNINIAELDVPMGTCNAQRDRILSPPSMQVSFVVIVSFHHQFVTKIDRAYRVQCVFMESEKIVTTQMGVSMPPTVELLSNMPSPTCVYKITNEGKPLTHVRVGDQANHEWICKSGKGNGDLMSNHYGLLVHSCTVDDGKGRKQEIIDERGCTLDPDILPTPHYRDHELSAAVSSLVVKPPDCSSQTQRNRTRRHAKDGSWRLHAPQLVVLDPGTSIDDNFDLNQLIQPRTAALTSEEFQEEYTSQFCVSVAGFGVLIGSTTFLVTISVGILLAAFCLRSDPLEVAIRRLAKNPT